MTSIKHSRFRLEISSAETIGKRKNQQDSFLIDRGPPNGLIRVCLGDGLGGHAYGQIASEIAVQEAMKVLRSDCEEDGLTFRDIFTSAFLEADKGIDRIPWHENDGFHPATTLIAGLLYPQGEIRLAGLGDSICWVIREHVHELLERQGAERWVEYAVGHSLGRPAGSAIRHASWVMRSGDRLLLATDGILTLSIQTILNVLATNPVDPAGALIAAVEAEGDEHQDNCVVIVISALEMTK